VIVVVVVVDLVAKMRAIIGTNTSAILSLPRTEDLVISSLARCLRASRSRHRHPIPTLWVRDLSKCDLRSQIFLQTKKLCFNSSSNEQL
jgi:hypothetical protein